MVDATSQVMASICAMALMRSKYAGISERCRMAAIPPVVNLDSTLICGFMARACGCEAAAAGALTATTIAADRRRRRLISAEACFDISRSANPGTEGPYRHSRRRAGKRIGPDAALSISDPGSTVGRLAFQDRPLAAGRRWPRKGAYRRARRRRIHGRPWARPGRVTSRPRGTPAACRCRAGRAG